MEVVQMTTYVGDVVLLDWHVPRCHSSRLCMLWQKIVQFHRVVTTQWQVHYGRLSMNDLW